MRTLVLSAAAVVALSLSVGCDGSSGQRETCSVCRGSGRGASGSACTFCAGRGYRELSRSEVDRRKHATENLRRRSSGEEPLSDTDWGWETGGKGVVGFLVVGLIVYILSGQHRRGSPPPDAAPSDVAPPKA